MASRNHFEIPDDASPKKRSVAEERAFITARIPSRQAYKLRKAIDHLLQQRIVPPGYTYLLDVVRQVLSIERKRLSEVLGIMRLWHHHLFGWAHNKSR